jgi:hypothetical protein
VDDLVAEDKCPQVVDDLTVIYRIPWGHNRTIIVPEEFKGSMPTIEEIEAELKE